MIVYGKNAVKELLKSGKTIDKICAQKGDKMAEALAMQAKEFGAKAIFCSRDNLDALALTKKHQGVLAYTTDYSYSTLSEILEGKKEGERLIVILDGVEDPHNLGSIIRSAECLGAAGIVIGKHRAASVNETVIKTACGAEEYVKVARVTNINDAVRELKDLFFKVYAMDMDGSELASADLSGDVAPHHIVAKPSASMAKWHNRYCLSACSATRWTCALLSASEPAHYPISHSFRAV